MPNGFLERLLILEIWTFLLASSLDISMAMEPCKRLDTMVPPLSSGWHRICDGLGTTLWANPWASNRSMTWFTFWLMAKGPSIMAFTWAATLSTMAGCRQGLAIPVKIVFTKTCANGATWLNAVLLGQALSSFFESSGSLQKHQPNM